MDIAPTQPPAPVPPPPVSASRLPKSASPRPRDGASSPAKGARQAAAAWPPAESVTPRPLSSPTKRNAAYEAYVRGVLNKAQLAFLDKLYRKAIELAWSVEQENPSRAWLIIGLSACRLEDTGLAKNAYRFLDAAAQKYMRSVCLQQRLVFTGTEFVKEVDP